MPQFRRDPFGSAWVLISPERGLEPSDFGSAQAGAAPLPDAREAAGRELRAVRAADSGEWRVRVLALEGSLLEAGKPFALSQGGLFQHASSSGYQELILEHPDPAMTLAAMPREHLVEVLKVYLERLSHLSSRPEVRHVQLVRNVGAVAGAMYRQPHAQLLAVPVPSRWLEDELGAAERHHAEHGRCLFCDVLAEELRARERLVSGNEHFVALAPYAAKTPFETWILPRSHASSFTAVAANALPQLAELLQGVVRAMNGALDEPPYNLLLHTLPGDGGLRYHWHIELLPRLTRQAGFDWGSGFYVNPTPPEDAARFLREALALQEVEL